MALMAQNPADIEDQIEQAYKMAADPAPVDPHAALTAPIMAAPRNELGDTMGNSNELGAALPAQAEAPPETPKMSPLNSQKEHLNKNLMADYAKDNTPSKGFFGHLIGGLDAAIPGVMEQFRGTKPYREKIEEPGLEKRVQDIGKQESEEGLQGAQQGKAEEETREAPAKNQSELGLQGAQTANVRSETSAREHPKEDWKAIPGAIGPNGEPIEIEATSGQVRYGGVTGAGPMKQPKPDTPEQQYIDEYQRVHKGSSIADAERAYTLDTQKPPQIQPIMMMIPNANGGSTATVVRPGTEIAPGAQTAAGVNSANTPTAQMRNTAQRAELVHAMTPELLQNINANASQLGPVMGHWNEFMQGKVGTENPNFAQLRADLLLYSSSVALAHAQGRLPENLREEFDNMINAPKQSPQNLTAVINRIDQAMQLNAKVMGGKGGQQQSTEGPPAGAKVRDYTQVGPK